MVVYACMSDSESKIVRYKTSDLSELTMYIGSANGAQTINIGGDTIQNMDSLRRAWANRYFASVYTSDRSKYEGNKISYEFSDNRVTYISRNSGDSIHQLVSTYEFVNDSLWIDMTGGKRLFAGLGSSPEDIYYRSGFAHFRGADTTIVALIKDTLLTDKVLGDKFGFAQDLSNLTAEDTIIWCNVKYLFGK